MMVRLSILYLLVTGHLLAEEFYGYYTHIDSKEAFEKPSRTGAHADIAVRIGDGQLVFWRGKSYLPYWQTPKGKWSLEEVVPRNITRAIDLDEAAGQGQCIHSCGPREKRG